MSQTNSCSFAEAGANINEQSATNELDFPKWPTTESEHVMMCEQIKSLKRDIAGERTLRLQAERISTQLQRELSLANDANGMIEARLLDVDRALVKRDTDWILAIGNAIGLDSGILVPIVPQSQLFEELFTEIRKRAAPALYDLQPALAKLSQAMGNPCIDWTDGNSMESALIDFAANRLSQSPPVNRESFQDRVRPWLQECFGAEVANNHIERNHRFVEEALELVQACGCTKEHAHQIVDYVYGRPAGEPFQEVGGVEVTLAALCIANSINKEKAAEEELARVWTKIDVIRDKQSRKVKDSALPGSQTATQLEPIYAAGPGSPIVGHRAPNTIENGVYLCSDCPPRDYARGKARCAECPRASATQGDALP